MYETPTATKNIIIINLIMFVATLLNEQFMVETFALFYPASHLFKPWQLVTHMFMHAGFWHIFFNMYALFIFGSVLERTIGTKKFLIYYFVSGIGAMLLHTGVGFVESGHYLSEMAEGSSSAQLSYLRLLATPTLGASGAIYGVLIGYAMLYPESVLTLIFPPISFKARTFVLIFAGIELLTGIFATADGVAHFAHLGGMLFGWLLMLYWRRSGRLWDNNY